MYQWPVELLVLGVGPGLRNETSKRAAVLIEERAQESDPALAKDTDQASLRRPPGPGRWVVGLG